MPSLVGGCLGLHWRQWRDRGAEPWVVEVLRWGYQVPFVSDPPLSAVAIPLLSYSPSSIKGKALQGEIEALIAKGAVKLAPSSPGFYSRLFVVRKAAGSWRLVIDLLLLNGFVQLTPFKMESNQSVLQSIRSFDWMIFIDLKDAYLHLQVPIHPASRKFLRFVVDGRVYQFKALCFGLSTTPQVFMRVMALMSSFLHSLGVRMLHYFDDWLVLASSHLEARDKVLQMCSLLGIVVNLEKSSLVPSQTTIYLGMVLVSSSLRAFPTPKRIETVQEQITGFLSSRRQNVVSWVA